MRFVFYHVVCFLLLTTLFAGNTFGQIFRVNADAVVAGLIAPTGDSIHVFYNNSTGSLKARPPEAGLATFEWNQYDTITNNFNITLPSTDSIVNNLPSGGYKVHITVSGNTYYYVAWVFIDKLGVTIKKDANGDNNYLWYTCEYTDFRATSSQSNFIYYNSKGQKQALPAPKFVWTANPPIEPLNKDTTSWLRMDTTKKMQYEKAVYKVFVKDKFGATSKSDSVKYSPIVCKAIIDTTGSYKVLHLLDGSIKNSAPFTVTFLNKSKNAVRYTWDFARFDNDTVKRHDTTRVTQTFTVTSPNDSTPYKVRLISQSLELCVDTTTFNIPVAPGQIERVSEKNDSLPTVFTPNNDGKNDMFRIYNISIRQFRFTVFSKWGKKVYEASGPNMLEWEGWDGDVLNTGRPASDGIYFYVLEVLSWDKTPNPDKMKTNGKYSGFLYLFRGK